MIRGCVQPDLGLAELRSRWEAAATKVLAGLHCDLHLARITGKSTKNPFTGGHQRRRIEKGLEIGSVRF